MACCVVLLLNQLDEAGGRLCQLLAALRDGADNRLPHDALAVQEQGQGQRQLFPRERFAKSAGEPLLAVEVPGGKRELAVHLLDEARHLAAVVLKRDVRDAHLAAVLIDKARPQLLPERELLFARVAPGGPQVQNHDGRAVVHDLTGPCIAQRIGLGLPDQEGAQGGPIQGQMEQPHLLAAEVELAPRPGQRGRSC